MSKPHPIYLDYNATTPVLPEVVKVMLPYFNANYWNPSSSQSKAKDVKRAIEKSRQALANLIYCNPEEIIFTSGGTESNNMAIRGIAELPNNKKKHIITTCIEHPAVLNVCKYLENLGNSITYLPVDKYGLIDPADVENSISPNTCLITIMHANNEVGTIQPISEIGAIARKYNIPFHTDACQSIGKIDCDVSELKVDLMTIAGHKMYAPKGIGALYLKSGTKLKNLLYGAGQENGRRPGTENAPYIIALGKASEIAKNEFQSTNSHLQNVTNQLFSNLRSGFDQSLILNGHPTLKLPNTLNISFEGISGNNLMENLQNQVFFSTGSACHAGISALSPVLKAMQVTPGIGKGTIRLSTGKSTTINEIDIASDLICRAVKKLRK